MEVEWVRGDPIGHGSFGSVNLAIPRNADREISPLMAVKSCSASTSATLRHERDVLAAVGDCPHIIQCFGDCCSRENGEILYNLVLEYAVGGNLADRVKKSASGGNCGLPESEIRRHARSILKALSHIHGRGFVHCDVKLQNILLCSSGEKEFDAKLADFGLSKRAGQNRGFQIRGTPMYMSPESVNSGAYDSPADIWAVGCAVAEMAAGQPAWRCSPETDVPQLMLRIGAATELPEIPGMLSEEGKDFLGRCFVKDPKKRWSAEMLLKHPFVVFAENENCCPVPLDDEAEEPSISPRGPFDFTEVVAGHCSYSFCSSTPTAPSPDSAAWLDRELDLYFELESSSNVAGSPPAERIRQLGTEEKPQWSFSDGWVTVR